MYSYLHVHVHVHVQSTLNRVELAETTQPKQEGFSQKYSTRMINYSIQNVSKCQLVLATHRTQPHLNNRGITIHSSNVEWSVFMLITLIDQRFGVFVLQDYLTKSCEIIHGYCIYLSVKKCNNQWHNSEGQCCFFLKQ